MKRRLNLDRYKEKPPRPEVEAAPVNRTAEEMREYILSHCDIERASELEGGAMTYRVPCSLVPDSDDFARYLPLREGWTRHIAREWKDMRWTVYDQPPVREGTEHPSRGLPFHFYGLEITPVAFDGGYRYEIPTDLRGGFRVTEESINSGIRLPRGWIRNVEQNIRDRTMMVIDIPMSPPATQVNVNVTIPDSRTRLQIAENVARAMARSHRRNAFGNVPPAESGIVIQQEVGEETELMQSIAIDPRELMRERRRQLRDTQRVEQIGQDVPPPPPPPPPPPARQVNGREVPPDIKDKYSKSWMQSVIDRLRGRKPKTEDVALATRAREAVAINNSVPREEDGVQNIAIPFDLHEFVTQSNARRVVLVFNVVDLTASGRFLRLIRQLPEPPEDWNVMQTFIEGRQLQFTYWTYEPGSPML